MCRHDPQLAGCLAFGDVFGESVLRAVKFLKRLRPVFQDFRFLRLFNRQRSIFAEEALESDSGRRHWIAQINNASFEFRSLSSGQGIRLVRHEN